MLDARRCFAEMHARRLAMAFLALALVASGACKLSTEGVGDVSLGGSGGAAGTAGEAGSGGASICAPGEQVACACTSGGSGVQECAAGWTAADRPGQKLMDLGSSRVRRRAIRRHGFGCMPRGTHPACAGR